VSSFQHTSSVECPSSWTEGAFRSPNGHDPFRGTLLLRWGTKGEELDVLLLFIFLVCKYLHSLIETQQRPCSSSLCSLSLFILLTSASAAAIPAAFLEERQSCSSPNVANLAKAKAEFTAAKIVPDVIPKFNPTLELSVAYGSKEVNFGNTFNTLG
jgi:hypothetical protein